MKRVSVFIMVSTLALAVGLTWSGRSGAADPKAVFEKDCSQCHSASRPLGLTKTAEGWRETVTRMQKNSGGKIAPEDTEIIIKYLTETRGAK